MTRVVGPAVLLAIAACSGRNAAPPGSTAHAPAAVPVDPPGGRLRAVAEFTSIADPAARSRALFLEVSRVLTHPRCVNCHPPDESPRQGDGHVLHDPPVIRGANDRGVVGMQCFGCHQDRNAELARIPGAPDWHLAPLSMAWLGKSPAQICAQIVAASTSGGPHQKTLAQVHEHLAHDKLVAWGFAPGADRRPPPGTPADVAALFDAWMKTGAVCPNAEDEVPR
ncbi:MAG: Isoquinoline 1-oxidoreductase subunit [Kofleriaceae bacterium]